MTPIHTVKAAARMAKEAYKVFPELPFNGQAEGVHFGTDNAYITRRLGQVFVVVLGTEFSFSEWLKNALFIKKSHPALGRVHRGFYANLRELWDELDDAGVFNESSITFVGHSRGGAIASLLALSYSYIYKKPCRIITFGSPRVGNKTWKKKFNAAPIDAIRVAGKHDPVTKLPFINYYHVGELLEVDCDHPIQHYIEALEE